MSNELEVPGPTYWPRWKKLCFRFALIYFLLYALPFPLDTIPDPAQVARAFGAEWPYGEQTGWIQEGVGEASRWIAAAERDVVDWSARHLFGFEHVLDRPLGSGDPTYSYVRLAVFLGIALIGAGLWTLLDRRQRAYRSLPAWLHLGVRFYLAFILLGYGFAKVHPSQFRAPGLARLVTPYGDASPMNLLWSFMGSSTAYIVFSGVAEVVPGLLLCFRRTATLGALVALAVLTNIVAMNYCYDVPVKLFSSHLLVFAAALCVPDLRRLGNVFVRNRTAPARDLSRPRLPYFGHVVKLLVVGTVLAVSIKGVVDRWTTPEPTAPLHGIWDVASFREDGVELAPLTTDPCRWNALLVESESFGWIQAMDGSLRSVAFESDEEPATLTISSNAVCRYRIEDGELVLQAEFARWFRADPSDFQSKGEPRDPQLELRLVRAAEVLPEEVLPEEALPAHDSKVPAELLGRWTVAGDARIGELATRRRSEPTGFVAVTFGADGSARVEYANGAHAEYEARADAADGSLTLRSSGTFAVARVGEDELTLTGDLRGHALELKLRRRDASSFLLVRRGYHWINEIPLNRY